jgi:hypothetical protein
MHRPPQLNPQQVHALLAGWYDLIGPQVGNSHGWGHRGPYGGQWAAGINPYLRMGADPSVMSGPPMPMAPPPMAPPTAPPPMAPPAVPPMHPHHMHQMHQMMQESFAYPPRAAVVDAPLPTQANRDILPMSTGVPILPTQSAQITGRPQCLVFKIGRFVISNAGTAGGSADWIVNDLKIGNVSQFVQSGDVPGDMFATNAIDTFVRFAPAQTAMDVVVVVTYIGLNESGCPFFGAMVGTAAV